MKDTYESAALTPGQIAGLRSGQRAAVRAAIAGLRRADLAAWLRTPSGREVLEDAFARMPDFYLPGQVDGEVRVRWRVTREPSEPVDHDLLLEPARCVVTSPDPAARPDVTLTFDSVGFVELACAARRGLDLMLHGHLHVRGDVREAMRMEKLFGLDVDEGDERA